MSLENNHQRGFNDDDSSSFDDDSDSDDFLVSSSSTRAAAVGTTTMRATQLHPDGTSINHLVTVNREAMVRKKLLENFYGKSVVTDGTGDVSRSHRVGSSHRKNDKTNEDDSNGNNVDDIDSKSFDINKFVTQHLQSSSVQTLLEIEEQLSLQVRTYDATMQTLVYENYTKFIDVTNAIKSIGTTVTATNEAQIQQLITCTDAIHRTSRILMMEDHNSNETTAFSEKMGTIRQQVVEKIRLQRLLQRLHSLFVLPQTVKQYIQDQQYITAITKYQHAAMILAPYAEMKNKESSSSSTDNEGTVANDTKGTKLESLSSITKECLMVLQQLYVQLKHQFYFWSGRSSLQQEFINDDDDKNEISSTILSVPQELPKSMTEIYESAKALFMLQELFPNHTGDNSGKNEDEIPEEIYSMSLSAATRFLDRLLDAHSIHVQEYQLMMMDPNDPSTHSNRAAIDDYNDYSSNNNSTGSLLGTSIRQVLQQQQNMDGTVLDNNTNYLIPQNVLVAILECAKLYKTNFIYTNKSSDTDHDVSEINYYLIEFITESYTTFMTHVRAILLQEEGNTSGDNQANLESGNDTPSSFRVSPEDISKALTGLVQYVQTFTNRLVDEVRLNVDFTNQLMRQAIDLASSLVRRRVDNQFRTLRYSIVNDCLTPFTNRIVKERDRIIMEKSDSSYCDYGSLNQVLPEIIQIASSTLSDCLQLIDDTIRSVFADTSSTTKNSDGSTVGIVPSDVQDAVQSSTYRLVSWLANTFEIIVGGDPTDYNHIAQALQPTPDEHNSGNDVAKAVTNEFIGDNSEDDLLTLLYAARENIYQDGAIHTDIILSMIELCRLSEKIVPQQIEQSLQYGSGKKKASSSQRELFPSSQRDESKSISNTSVRRKNSDRGSNSYMSNRFQVAGSRIFTILIQNIAYEATYQLLSNDINSSESTDTNGRRPSGNVLMVAQSAKMLSLQCATLFGGTKRAGPVPIWDDANFISGTSMISAVGMLSNRKSGLYLDVERMFKEKISIYPHPSDILEYLRDTAIFLYFKIVIRSWYENIREYIALPFSSDEYYQMQIDTIFVRYIIPHYLSNDFHDHNGTNGRTALTTLMNDILEVMEDRYHHATDRSSNDYGQNDHVQRNARNTVRSFMVSVESDTKVADTFIIRES